jgi:hypothetical protein
VTFQHTVLREHGRYTCAGRWALVLLGAWLLFTAHTFSARRLRASAMEAARQPIQVSIYGGRAFDAAQARAALARMETATAWVAIADPELLELHALLLGSLGQHADAEAELVSLRARFGDLAYQESNMALAGYCMRDPARRDLAEQLLRGVLSRNPGNYAAQTLLGRIEALRGR